MTATASARTTRLLNLPGVITNCSEPLDTLPLMSSASHRNVVVSVRWKTCPGSRGPVESHSGELLVGRDPSVV